jgi:hypothetical protein
MSPAARCHSVFIAVIRLLRDSTNISDMVLLLSCGSRRAAFQNVLARVAG